MNEEKDERYLPLPDATRPSEQPEHTANSASQAFSHTLHILQIAWIPLSLQNPEGLHRDFVIAKLEATLLDEVLVERLFYGIILRA